MTQRAPQERPMPGLDYPPTPDYPPATDYSSMPERTARPSYPLLPSRRERLLAQQEQVLAREAARLPGAGQPAAGQPQAGPVLPGEPGETLRDVFQPAAPPTGAPLPRGGQVPVGQPGEARDEPPGGVREGQEAAPAAGEAGERQERLAMLGYLTVPIFGPVVPLAARLTAGRASPWLRGHATQAFNVWLTVFIYDISGAIMGTMLALDSPWVAVGVMVPVMVALWGVTIARLIRAGTAAGEGRNHTFPGWLCSQIVR